ncbi:MAG: hypothetical protein D3911_15600 [Candidatus Electrothrix sp. AW3_4]|nr:hypothetical protein [Candidatus Electrothrix gigas]
MLGQSADEEVEKEENAMMTKEGKRQGDSPPSTPPSHLRTWTAPKVCDIRMSATASGGLNTSTENAVSFSHTHYQSPTS